MPSPCCRPPSRKKDTSAPNEVATECSSFSEISILYSLTSPFITDAALDEPPPNPLPAGMLW
ncbi:hypothetical protein Ct9H90mP29_04850 [bacterium]|nr:MAG: hypothetical protein Ct9H90mP29_04850 [bacterium]